MDIQTVTSLISSVGFPIVCCIVMYKTMIDMQKTHKEETDKLRESVDANTRLLTELIAKIEVLFNEK